MRRPALNRVTRYLAPAIVLVLGFGWAVVQALVGSCAFFGARSELVERSRLQHREPRGWVGSFRGLPRGWSEGGAARP